MRIRPALPLLWALTFALACPSDDKADNKPKTDSTPAKEPVAKVDPSLEVEEGDPPVDGPVPPDTNMVFYTVEGGLYPLACFDKDKKALLSGRACLEMAKEGAEVRLSSIDAEYNRVAGATVEPQCLAGSGKQIALNVEGISTGAQFVFATWPRSAMNIVKVVPEESTDPYEARVSDEEAIALKKAIGSAGSGELGVHQVAEIDVDGDKEKEKVYSVFIPDPKVNEQYVWSGLLLAMGGDLSKLTVIEKSKTKRDVFELKGVLDIDGDNVGELWMRLVFEEGGGDRIVDLVDGKPVPVTKWTCGA